MSSWKFVYYKQPRFVFREGPLRWIWIEINVLVWKFLTKGKLIPLLSYRQFFLTVRKLIHALFKISVSFVVYHISGVISLWDKFVTPFCVHSYYRSRPHNNFFPLKGRIGSAVGYDSAINITRALRNSRLAFVHPDTLTVVSSHHDFAGVNVTIHEKVPWTKGKPLRGALVYFHGGGWVYEYRGKGYKDGWFFFFWLFSSMKNLCVRLTGRDGLNMAWGKFCSRAGM